MAYELRVLPRVTIDDGRVFVRGRTGLLRFDAEDGSKRWSVDVDHLSPWVVHGDRVYAARTDLYAFDAGDGDERWIESVAEGLLVRGQVAADDGETGGEDRAVFVEDKDVGVHRGASDGDVTGSETVPGDIRGVVDERLYVGTSESVYAVSVE